ncbi:type II toxin-antitoxin system PemK/MazF family toxin [Leucobacter aridicollis]|uniref:type II toxin-antitoxin system PemK/MazF family toxin n=1 Tax=Leucobacter aridicollis TaxID=283878 RepID=UPI0021048507|nr:type II toxin-antitoxin system PemK/MazF family toxin [Leucobacter aridicollis]UTX54588.1 type II toxin-antitoxin system PemK/MazF family toxin [Leucobacter aridicollis]
MASDNIWYQIGVALRRILGLDKQGTRPQATLKPKSQQQPRQEAKQQPQHRPQQKQGSAGEYAESPGQFGPGATRDVAPGELAGARLEYSPSMDGDPDPGEIVWTWVPYVENDGRGKDRPVLIIGRIDATTVFGCYVSSKYHRDFISIGSGAWDSQGRESFVSPERILRVTHDGMRREGATIPKDRFTAAVRGVLDFHGLS